MAAESGGDVAEAHVAERRVVTPILDHPRRGMILEQVQSLARVTEMSLSVSLRLPPPRTHRYSHVISLGVAFGLG
jgi:hypothetical protein